jgi:uncharacterized protein
VPNRLGGQSSPYLRQHADNPVDWWPWGDAAWEEARSNDRPVLLSVGYSACHWCHVMAHESFEDTEIAELMNRLFVCIKVDREERPDIDSVYMQAVQAMTGQGGWPMTVFCTPRGVPYFGGTYFPPEDRHGIRGFPYILEAAADAYHTRRDAVDRTGDQLREALTPPRLRSEGELDVSLLESAATRLVDQTDRRYGGFGGAPKFPHSAALDVLLRRTRASGERRYLDAAVITLDHMARGGVADQVGGGFHRYSVDAQWAIPHFEKMLYDNAQLAPVYLHAWQLSGEERWREVCEGTLDWALREMRVEGGGFASALDADDPGGEGAFYSWTPQQLRDALGEEDGELAARIYGVTPAGNFEHGATVLSIPFPLAQVATSMKLGQDELQARTAAIRERLREVRARRPAPGRDDKVIASWNALMLGALAECGFALDRSDYVDAARTCAAHLLETLVVDGRLMRSHLDGRPSVPGFLEDSAFLTDALLTLHGATGEARWFRTALEQAEDMLARFHDPVGGFYDTAIDGEPLLVRPRSLDDSPIPAGQSAAAHALLRLAAATGEDRWREPALATLRPLGAVIARSPLGLANLAWALEAAVGDMREVAVAGDPAAEGTAELLSVLRSTWDPLRVVAWGEADGVPLMRDRTEVGGRPAAYVCRGFVCDTPTTDPEALRGQLEGVWAAR